MGFDEGRIVVDSPNGTYYAGQTIFGKLEFQQDKTKILRGIYVKVHGYAKVHWTSDHTRKIDGKKEHYKKHHDAQEEYFTIKQYLVGNDHGEYHLQPGFHVLPFQAHIPAHCPSSMIGEYGQIQYEIKAVVDRALKMDQEKITTITVIAPLDLNQNIKHSEPMEFHFDETYCCCCFSYGSIETKVVVPASGFCPGQRVPVDVTCSNRSTLSVPKIKLFIRKEMKFHAHDVPGTKVHEEFIVETKKGPVEANTTKNWVEYIEIPPTAIANIDSCRIIDLNYYFKVKVCPSGCHGDVSDKKKFRLGTTPLASLNTSMISANPNAGQSQAYSGGHQPYPAIKQPTATPYPTANTPYPTANPQLNAAYPAQPSNVAPYPGAHVPYPSANVPYPSTNVPSNPPYPIGNTPYPAAPPPYPLPSSVGFKSEGQIQRSAAPPVPMPQPMVSPAPWTQTSPPVPQGGYINRTPESRPLIETPSSPYNPDFMNKH